MFQVVQQPTGELAIFNIHTSDFELIDGTLVLVRDFLIEHEVVNVHDGLDAEIERSVRMHGGWPSLDLTWDRAGDLYAMEHGDFFDLDEARTSAEWEDYGAGLEDFYGFEHS